MATLPSTLPFVLTPDPVSGGTELLIDGFGAVGWLQYTNIAKDIAATGKKPLYVPYNNQISSEANMTSAMNTLDTYITSINNGTPIGGVTYTLPITVTAISMGSQLAAKWLREKGPTTAVSPSNLNFVLLANPEQRYTGILVIRPDLFPTGAYRGPLVGDAGIGIPAGTPFHVTEFTRQYDGVADFPNVPNPDPIAVANAVAGIGLIHNFYLDATLDDPANASYVNGNITYTWSPTRIPAPQYIIDIIEGSYLRPITVPPLPPVVPPIPVPASPESLASSEAWKVAEAAEQIANQKDFYKKDWVVTVCDKFWRPVGELGDDMMELSGSDPWNNMPTATLKIKGDSLLTSAFESCKDTLVGVIVETGGVRFPFYVDTFDRDYQQAEWTGTANLLGIWDILNYLQIWPEWFFPIQAQPISHAVYIGNLCTAIESMIAEQALRIQSGLWEFINNALSLNFDMRSWFGALLQGNGNIFDMLKTPVYVVRTNPFLDTSPLIARTVRMESCGAVITDITKAYGVDTRVDLWLPGDAQPDPWANLTQPTYVVTAKDRMQIEGPTKTVLDSVIGLVVDIGGSFFGEIDGIIKQVPGMEGVYHSPALGQHYVPPWAILEAPDQGEKGSVVTCKISYHTPKGWQHIIGGRSPKWLNDLMNATYAWIIDSISIVIGFSGIPSNLLEGFLNNAFLAFQLVEMYDRRNAVGPYHPAIETFTATASSPYNIETLFGFINKIWDTRGYVAAQATFEDGVIYKLGKDIMRGQLMSVTYDRRTKLFTDYIMNILFRITPQERHILVQIGDGKAQEAPLAKHQRFVTGIIESINVLTLAPQS